jgi:hypothetical protein
MLLHSVVLLGLLILMGFQEVLALIPLVVQEVLALIPLAAQEVLALIPLVVLPIQLWEEVITWDLQTH